MITVTKDAVEHIQRHLDRRGSGIGIRVGVRTTGCSGMAYVFEFVDNVADEDVTYEEYGVMIVVDPKSLVFLDGSEIDFVKDGLNEGFKFNNPNVNAECGCGESFTV